MTPVLGRTQYFFGLVVLTWRVVEMRRARGKTQLLSSP